MKFLIALLLCVTLVTHAFLNRGTLPASSTKKVAHGSLSAVSGDVKPIGSATAWPDVEKCLFREYTSFFNPFEKQFYAKDVSFKDPLTELSGTDAYQNNIDMLGGKTMLGNILFEDASIVLHNIRQTGDRNLETRWTLKVTAKSLPWKPRAEFTGISAYTLNDDGKIVRQEDFWDSINLKNGKYEAVGKVAGLSDFLGQLKDESGAQMAAPELPYELLRRGKRYEVRRYPATTVAETTYDQRPEGYDRLGSYAGGSNVEAKRVDFFSPTLMRIDDSSGKRTKVMTWPMAFGLPGEAPAGPETLPEPTINRVDLKSKEGIVVAVTRFDLAATEPIVRGFTAQLMSDIKNDGMTPSDAAEGGECIVGQFDALFSLNKRRNEVWVELVDHPWL